MNSMRYTIKKRYGDSEVASGVKLVIVLIVAFILGAAVLPTALGSWWNQTNGAVAHAPTNYTKMTNMDAGSKAIWPLVAMFGVLSFLLAILAMAFKRISGEI